MHDSFEFAEVKLSVAIFVYGLEQRSQLWKGARTFLPDDVFELQVDLLNSNLLVDAEVCHFY